MCATRLFLSRARPVEQGCLKRPVSRKLGRQESVDELDREKLKAKVVVKKPDGLSEKTESRPKPHGLGSDLENLLCFRLKRETRKSIRKASERSNHFESKVAMQEAQPLSSLLKDASTSRPTCGPASGITLRGQQQLGTTARGPPVTSNEASTHSTLQDGLCHNLTHRSTSGKGGHRREGPPGQGGSAV